MDSVSQTQFRQLKDDFAARGVTIDAVYTPEGEIDYLYEVGRLLVRDDAVPTVLSLIPGLVRLSSGRGERDDDDGSVDDDDDGDRTVARGGLGLTVLSVPAFLRPVPELLDLLDELANGDRALLPDGMPLASPVHVVHVARICPAGEPSVPGCDDAPCPPPCPDDCDSDVAVPVGVSDTGYLHQGLAHSWLIGVDGEDDPLGPVQPSNLPLIEQYSGHGTFIAGVLRCMAPRAAVYVNNHFTASGGELEDVIVRKLGELAAGNPPVFDAPELINLSAGLYTRDNLPSLGFEQFHATWPQVLLVAAAGNDRTDTPFYPAASTWALGVGALGADRKHRAWFSNFGPCADVYAPGEGLVNAFAAGEYVYREDPRTGAVQTFDGMARWDGTSFAAPLVAGLIAAELGRRRGRGDTVTVDEVKDSLLAFAAQQATDVGPVLYPCDRPGSTNGQS